MSIDEKLLMQLAGQLGISGDSSREMRRAQQQANSYEGRSEQDLLQEIMSLKANMRSNPEMYQKQMKAIRSLRSMMNGEQRARLDRLIQLLEKE